MMPVLSDYIFPKNAKELFESWVRGEKQILIVSVPAKTGKTLLLRYLEQNPPPGYQPVYIQADHLFAPPDKEDLLQNVAGAISQAMEKQLAATDLVDADFNARVEWLIANTKHRNLLLLDFHCNKSVIPDDIFESLKPLWQPGNTFRLVVTSCWVPTIGLLNSITHGSSPKIKYSELLFDEDEAKAHIQVLHQQHSILPKDIGRIQERAGLHHYEWNHPFLNACLFEKLVRTTGTLSGENLKDCILETLQPWHESNTPPSASLKVLRIMEDIQVKKQSDTCTLDEIRSDSRIPDNFDDHLKALRTHYVIEHDVRYSIAPGYRELLRDLVAITPDEN